MKAKSLMTAALTLSFLLMPITGFSETVSPNGLKSTSILSETPSGHGPRGAPFENIDLTANDRLHGWGWGTLLQHGHRGQRASSLRLRFAAASSGGVALLVLAEDSEEEDSRLVLVPPNTAGSVTFFLTASTAQVAEVPEPTPLILLGASLFAVAIWKLRKMRRG